MRFQNGNTRGEPIMFFVKFRFENGGKPALPIPKKVANEIETAKKNSPSTPLDVIEWMHMKLRYALCIQELMESAAKVHFPSSDGVHELRFFVENEVDVCNAMVFLRGIAQEDNIQLKDVVIENIETGSRIDETEPICNRTSGTIMVDNIWKSIYDPLNRLKELMCKRFVKCDNCMVYKWYDTLNDKKRRECSIDNFLTRMEKLLLEPLGEFFCDISSYVSKFPNEFSEIVPEI